MIKANNLRLGNFVYFKDAWFKSEYAEITCIQSHCVLIKDFVGTPDIKQIYPIPITNDILEMCGFNDTGTRIVGSDTPIEWRLPDYTKVIIDGNSFAYELHSDDWGTADKTVYTRYLHELQNIHFCITGEEILFNKKTTTKQIL